MSQEWQENPRLKGVVLWYQVDHLIELIENYLLRHIHLVEPNKIFLEVWNFKELNRVLDHIEHLLWHIHVEIVISVRGVSGYVEIEVKDLRVRLFHHFHLNFKYFGSFKDQEARIVLDLHLVNFTEVKHPLMLLTKDVVQELLPIGDNTLVEQKLRLQFDEVTLLVKDHEIMVGCWDHEDPCLVVYIDWVDMRVSGAAQELIMHLLTEIDLNFTAVHVN